MCCKLNSSEVWAGQVYDYVLTLKPITDNVPLQRCLKTYINVWNNYIKNIRSNIIIIEEKKHFVNFYKYISNFNIVLLHVNKNYTAPSNIIFAKYFSELHLQNSTLGRAKWEVVSLLNS